MKYGILIKDGPYNHQASDSAYNFIKAAQKRGHEIVGIFMYNDGVLCVTNKMDPPQDDRHISNRWSEFGAEGIEVVICIAAAKRRGINDDTIVPNTIIAGLGKLTDIAIKADKFMVFGD